MGTMPEVQHAVTVIEGAGCSDYAILHCTSNYPTAPEDVNLLAMCTLADAISCPVGYSDHTRGIDIAIGAAAPAFATAAAAHGQSLRRHEFEERHMGTLFRVTLYCGDDATAAAVATSPHAAATDAAAVCM